MGALQQPFRFEITDGTTTIDLINGDDGFFAEGWIPAVPQYKGGGAFQDSPLADGRRLVNRQFTTITENIPTVLVADSPDMAQRSKQELRRLLEKAADYGETEWQTTPVYLVAQGRAESNPRYALVIQGVVPDNADPFGPDFDYPYSGRRRSTDEPTLTIEHSLWTKESPGTATQICAYAGETFNDRDYGTIVSALSGFPYMFFYDDSTGLFSTNLADGPFPTKIMVNGSTAGDIVYFGATEPFVWMNFILNSGQDGTADTVWEYWNGVSWTSFTGDIIKDTTGTAGFPGQFSLRASGFLNFPALSGWKLGDVNGVVLYWARIRLTGVPITDDIEVDENVTYSTSDPCSTTFIPFIASKRNVANISHVYQEDNVGAYSANLMDSALPYDLLTTNTRYLYFGSQTSLTDSGPFNNLIVDLIGGTKAGSVGWQYWNGAWAALTVQDNTSDLTADGVKSVHWEQPTNWATTVVNGVTAYWVRMTFTVDYSAFPQQQNRHVYSCTWPHIEIPATAVGGDIPALMKQVITNRSNAGSSFTTSPHAWTQRVIAGLRTLSRGEDFTAYLNCSDEQNPSGVTVSVLNGGAFANKLNTPTGRDIMVTFAGTTTTFTPRARFTLSSTLAPQWLGTYHVYARCFQDKGSGGEIVLQASVTVGSAGASVVSSRTDIPTITEWGLMDLGELTIAAPTDPDSIVIDINCTTSDTLPELHLYDLILIPTDEWAIDMDGSDQNSLSATNGESFVADSINQKYSKRAWCQDSTGLMTNNLTGRGPSPVIARPNAAHRFWFLVANGSTHSYAIANQVTPYVNQRYLSGRGNR